MKTLNPNYFIQLIPGLILALVIALIARSIESLLPLPLISASVIAMFIGIFINSFRKSKDSFSPGIQFSSKKILRLAIILLGTGLNISMVFQVGKLSLSVMVFTLLTCFGGGYLVGKLLGLNWKLSNLISAGTGICGGSAIAAIAPVIDASDSDMAYAMSATFIFDMAMILLFPIVGQAMGLTDMAYGLWTGTAVNDTSSVIAAGYAFSESAGDFATMVKLTRSLVIIPTVIIFALVQLRLKKSQLSEEQREKEGLHVEMKSIIPWFIFGFLFFTLINSLGMIPPSLAASLKEVSKFLMVMALAAIGLKTEFDDMKKSGLAPMVHGFIISALVVVVALAVEVAIGLI